MRFRRFGVLKDGWYSFTGLSALCLWISAVAPLPVLSQTVVSEPLATFGLGQFNCADYSPDGRFIVTGGSAGAVGVWDAATGSFVRRIQAFKDYVLSLAVSPDGSLLAASPWIHDSGVQIRDLNTGQLLLTLPSANMRSVLFSPDGSRIILAGGSLTIWDSSSGQLLQTWPVTSVYRAALSPDGGRLATGHSDGTVRVWDLATSQVLQTLVGHSGFATSVSFSADGARLLSSSSDKTAKIWDLATSQVLQTFTHEGSIFQAAFSPDGARVVTGSFDRTAKVWDAETGTLLHTLKGHGDRILVARFSPDGSTILTGSTDHTVRLWDADTGALLRIDRGHEKAPNAAEFVPGGTRILAGSALWDTADGRFLRMFVEDMEEVRTAAVSPDGSRVATGTADGTIRLWDVEIGALLQSRVGHSGEVSDLDFAPDSRRLVSASDDKTLKVWDIVTSRILLTYAAHDYPVTQVAWSPDGSRVCSGDEGGLFQIWDPNTGESFYHPLYPAPLGGTINSIDFSPDSRFILIRAQDSLFLLGALSGVQVWGDYSPRHVTGGYPALFSSDGSKLLAMTSNNLSYDFALCDYLTNRYSNIEEVLFARQTDYSAVFDYGRPADFSSDSSRILAGYPSGRVLLWDSHLPATPPATPYPTPTPSPTPYPTPPLPPPDTVTKPVQFYGLGSADAAVLSPDGQTLVTGGSAAAFVWDVATGMRIHDLYGIPGRVNALVLSPDNNRVVAGTSNREAPVRLWDIQTGELVGVYNGSPSIVFDARSVAVSHNGQSILAGLANGQVALWDVATSTPIRTFSGDAGIVNSVTFSPDDSLVASGSDYGAARIWDAATGTLLATFAAGKGRVNSVAFSPDGTRIVTGNAENVAQLIDIASSRTLLTFIGHTDAVLGAVFSPDGTRILTRSSDNTAREWDAATGALLQTFQADPDSVLLADYTESGTPRVITRPSVLQDLTLRGFSNGQALQAFSGHVSGAVIDAAVSPDGLRVATAMGMTLPLAFQWDAATGKRTHTLTGDSGWVESLAYSPDATRILTGSNMGTAKLWDAATGELLKTFQSTNNRVLSVDFSPDGSIALVANELWDVETGVIIRSLPLQKTSIFVDFSPRGDQVLTTTLDGITLWDVNTGLPIASLPPTGTILRYRSAVFSPDGSLVAAGSYFYSGAEVVLWNPFRNEIVRSFAVPWSGVYFVAFSPDGTHLAAGGGDPLHKVWLWDVQSGQILRTFSGFTGFVESVDFTPDGRQVVIGCGDGTTTLWDADLFTSSSFAFDFSNAPEDWSFVSAAPYDPPDHSAAGSGGGIVLRAANNTSTFGYWESQPFTLWGDMGLIPRVEPVVAGVTTNPIQSVYAVDWRVKSSVADRAQVPQLRLRVTEENLQQSHFLAVESRADGLASADADGEDYSLVFSHAPGSSQARIAFDLLNFDPADAPDGDLQLAAVTVTRRNPADLDARRLLRHYTFDEGDEAWTSHAARAFVAPTFATEPGALTITGTGSANAFGFWTSPAGDISAATNDPAVGNPVTEPSSAPFAVGLNATPAELPASPDDVLYIATFTVESDVAAAERGRVPQFRLRLNEGSLHAASVVAVESRGDANRSAVAGEPQTYTVFYRPPAPLQHQPISASFDYLNFDPADDAGATLKLHDVTLEAMEYPW